ncbi:MAG TPA: hypothetical protein VK973_16620 [Arenicellales bacterium]|nr:hypothetical protein [Arenicellales bacterium]
MHDHMNAPWRMGGGEWALLGVFWAASIVVVALLVLVWWGQQHPMAPVKIRPTVREAGRWRSLPEVQLAVIGLPLSLLWEVAQFPVYTVWHQNDWGYIFYGLAHCTLGDVLILLAIYELVALLNRNRCWIDGKLAINGFLFTLAGLGYTIYSEIANVRIKGTWGYTDLMPIVPVVEIGGTPFLQWLLIPPVLLGLMRLLRRTSEFPA